MFDTMKNIFIQDSDEMMITKYVHKKFSKSKLSKRCNVITRSPRHLESEAKLLVEVLKTDFTLPLPLDQDQNIDSSDVLDISDCEFEEIIMLGLEEINTICMTYLIEEAPFMNHMKDVFFNSWREINFGESIMPHYIAFAKDNGVLSPHYLYWGQMNNFLLK